ncbi:MAG: EamA family transporter [Oscillospiraceae bacterium]|nr:EamA family transporter [Oscillospiraceae bacterium]MBQ5738942.1 EamA family transporter [Oscillospiraceae bacterium]
MEENKSAKLQMLFSMALFGTIGLFVRAIPLPSSAVAMIRGFVGAAFLLVFTLARGKKISLAAIRENLLLLCVSGAAIGVNWILLFEAYRYTSVATATICYYLAPVFLVLSAPLTLGEKLTAKKIVCVVLALAGTAFLSGGADGASLRGIACGCGAAVFYASVMTLNKKMRDITAADRTLVQLFAAGLCLLPYVLATENVGEWSLTALQLALLAFVGIVHTGYTYALYFGAVAQLPTQTVALYSYIDPLVAVLLSALVLREPFTVQSAVGAALVLGSTLWNELNFKKR